MSPQMRQPETFNIGDCGDGGDVCNGSVHVSKELAYEAASARPQAYEPLVERKMSYPD